MNKIVTIIVFIVIIGAGAAFFFLAPKSGSGQQQSMESTVENKIIPVKVVPATEGRLQNYIKLSGDVTPSSTIDVMPNTSGKLTNIHVKLGDYVVKNQIIARVDPSRPGSTFALSPVKAPISGTITKVIGDIGKTVAPSVPVLQIGQLHNLEIVTQVSERYISYIKKGEKALVKVQAIPDKALTAYVTEISPVVNMRTRTMEISLALNGGSKYLKAGMLADITLILEDKKNIIRIPEEAILTKGDLQFVYIVDSANRAEEKIIKTGLKIDGYAEVIEGLNKDDKVILSGKALITGGTNLQIMETLSALPEEGNIRR